eukprot:2177713-Prymnesium_polylepis.1
MRVWDAWDDVGEGGPTSPVRARVPGVGSSVRIIFLLILIRLVAEAAIFCFKLRRCRWAGNFIIGRWGVTFPRTFERLGTLEEPCSSPIKVVGASFPTRPLAGRWPLPRR